MRATVVVGYYDQGGSELDPTARVREVVAGPTRAPGGPEDGALMERFWFGGALAFAPVSTLSGGERRRLQLLVVLATQPNVLLLDEPTNDLDIDTLRILEDYLEAWPGALVTISHDRAFLHRATDQLAALGDDGRLRAVAGGLDAWLAQAEAASAPAGRAIAAPTTTPSRPASSRPARGNPARGRAAGSNPSPSTIGFKLREVERTMARLERQRARLEADLAAATGHEEMAQAGSALAELLAEVDRAEEAWLGLATESEG